MTAESEVALERTSFELAVRQDSMNAVRTCKSPLKSRRVMTVPPTPGSNEKMVFAEEGYAQFSGVIKPAGSRRVVAAPELPIHGNGIRQMG